MKRKINQTNIPGFGFIYLPTYRGKRDGKLKQSAVWWMEYETRNGEFRKSTKTRDQGEAFRLLMKTAGQVADGKIVTREPEKVRIGQLLNNLIESYAEKSTLYDLKKRVEKHLRPRFGILRAVELGTTELREFVASLKRKHKSAATINRCLANLHRALKLGMSEDPPLVLRIPGFPWQSEADNARQGRMDHDQYQQMCDDFGLTAPHARLALVIGYHVGMRRGELFSLRWDQVDFDNGVLRLERKQVKNKTARTIPIYGEMRGWLEMAKAERDAKYPNCAYVVAYEGHRIDRIDKTWKASLRRLKLPKILLHDLRRTAASNMRKAGIDEIDVMRCMGWKSRAMFIRYNITNDRDTARVGRKMETWQAERVTEETKGSVQ